MLGHYTNGPLVGADGVAPPEYLNNSFTDCPATIYGISSQIGGELGTRTLTLIARASKTRMATNYINSPLIFVLVPPVIFEMTTFRSSGGCSYHVSYRGIVWCPERESNPHAEASELKSDVYASFTTGTYVWLRWLDSNQRNATVKVSCLINWLHLNMIRNG